MSKDEKAQQAGLQRQGGRHALRFERTLRHPPEKVWRALTDNAELAAWFPAQIQGERRAGARLRFDFQRGPEMDKAMQDSVEEAIKEMDEAKDMHGEIIAWDPPWLFEYTWGPETLRFELEARDNETRLVFTHIFDDESEAARDAVGWEVCLDALLDRLAGRAPQVFSKAHFDARFEVYAERFGAKASRKRHPG